MSCHAVEEPRHLHYHSVAALRCDFRTPHPGCRRFLQRGHDLLQAALRPFICASGVASSPLASCTSEPNAAWVTQQARNLSWRLEDEGINLSVLIHDRDKKFAPEADRVFQSQGARVILTPLMAPRANAHAERWIGNCRRECLDWMLVVNQRHLETVINEYCLHYNDERPHRSRNLRPPASRSDRMQIAAGQIERRTRLGGLLSDYRPIDDGRVTSFSNPTRPLRRARSVCRPRSYRVCQRTPETSATIV